MLDVIEIDGASNNGVENVRDLIEKARFEPNQGTYKIYIIDEVHMLSTGAFNALLKTLEEPPSHVKFILATTEIDKVPETIRSRSLRFDFRKITESDIISRLAFVAKTEGIKIDTEWLAIIAKAARGGLRDALTLLEQHTINNEVSTEYVRTSLSLLEESLIDEVIDTLLARDTERILHILETLGKRHILVRGFFDQILYALRDRIFASFQSTVFHEYEEIFAIFESAYGKIKVIPDSMLLIEITLIRAVKRGTSWAWEILPKSKKTEMKDEKPAKKEEVKAHAVEKDEWILWTVKAVESLAEPITPSVTASKELPEAQEWDKGTPAFSFILLLGALKSSKPALVTDLKNAQFAVDGTTLKLAFNKEWNYNRVNVADVHNILSDTLGKLFGWIWSIECVLWNGTADIAEGVF